MKIRKKYLSKVIPHIGKPIIKVIVGQRRVGKSYVLRQIRDEIEKSSPHVYTIFIDMERFEYSQITSAKALIEYVESRTSGEASPPSAKARKDSAVSTSAVPHKALFIDEVQEINGFEKGIRHFLSKGYDIYITGSNSHILSGELASMLTGRYVAIPIYPLDFSEFTTFHDLPNNEATLNKYLLFGGMPYLLNVNLQGEIVYDYLETLYRAILFKDVVSRYQIKNVDFLQRLLQYLARQTGSILSAHSISDFMKSQRQSISSSVVLNYLGYLTDAFIVNKAQRYDIYGKRLLEVGEKYYFNDLGIRNVLAATGPPDISKVIENVVYNHLLAQNYNVTVGVHHSREVDFIARRGEQQKYIQVTYMLTDEKVVDREYGNLKKIKDHYQKLVISLDPLRFDPVDGIVHFRLIDWLSEDEEG